MTDREKFLFDLQGFLVVEDVLTATEVKALNDAFDANGDKKRDDGNSHPDGDTFGPLKRGMFSGMLSWDQPWCQPFRDLLSHPGAIPYLDTLFGRGWKMDHSPFMLTCGKGTKGLRIHGSTNVRFNGSQYYTYRNGTMRCGMIVCAYQLADVNEGDGRARTSFTSVSLQPKVSSLRGRYLPDIPTGLGIRIDRGTASRPRTAIYLQPALIEPDGKTVVSPRREN